MKKQFHVKPVLTLGASDQRGCQHPKLIPEFDAAAARKMTSTEVRKTYPRAYGKCPDCGWEGVLYASYEHYVMGDY
jgi:hypothetical protein